MTRRRKFWQWVAWGGPCYGLCELLAWITRTDFTHWVRMREQVSDAYRWPENASWT